MNAPFRANTNRRIHTASDGGPPSSSLNMVAHATDLDHDGAAKAFDS